MGGVLFIVSNILLPAPIAKLNACMSGAMFPKYLNSLLLQLLI